MSSILKSAIQWANANANASLQKDLCETCGKKPKFVENGFQHPYCGRTCARNGSSSNIPPCLLANCRRGAGTAYGGCCSDEHFREALRNGQVQACLHCQTMPRTIGQLCTACERRRRAKPRLREVDASDVTFTSIATQLAHEWQGPQTGPPVVKKIIEVIPSRETKSRFDAHRRKVDATGKLRDLRTYHGSQCICDFAVNDLMICSWQSCGICNIVKSSFAVFAFDVKYNTGRFGDGIYSYTNPASADKFATSSTTSPYRAMIACDVAISARNDSKQVTDGETIFLGNSDAILPAYIILYTL